MSYVVDQKLTVALDHFAGCGPTQAVFRPASQVLQVEWQVILHDSRMRDGLSQGRVTEQQGGNHRELMQTPECNRHTIADWHMRTVSVK